MARMALIVGINSYQNLKQLHGCVNDAESVYALLSKNDDAEKPEYGSKNFECKLITKEDRFVQSEVVHNEKKNLAIFNKTILRDEIKDLFETEGLELALFYFSGHGLIDSDGGYICPPETKTADDCIPLNKIVEWASKSPATNKVIIIDSCHSGAIGENQDNKTSTLGKNMTLLASSTATQYSSEENDQGLFTGLMLLGLEGAAANIIGDVTPASIYSHIDQSLGRWYKQRPIFKSNVSAFVVLRKAKPPIALKDLKEIVKLFPSQTNELPDGSTEVKATYKHFLNETYEPEDSERHKRFKDAREPDKENCRKFAMLQKYNRVYLVVPKGGDEPHMWHAAMQKDRHGYCELTLLGEHYRGLVEKGLI